MSREGSEMIQIHDN
ncbi:Protein of unknown function [Bacillus wiedmannii]|uniref:Uncharacterized protein n=1 Tax=Bacillus wiedmannii TaxID=1890302 RepID=A0AB37YKW0_9BACI|nr:Protein of unknown function [Bacillus wiedmannii]